MLYPEARALSVSDRSPSRKVEGQHIDTLPAPQREAIEERFRKMGVDTARMREIYLSRWAYNIWAFGLLGELYDVADPKFVRDQPELFEC